MSLDNHHPEPAVPDRFAQATLLRAQGRRYWNVLRKWWWVPVVSLIVCGAPGVLFSAMTPRSYRSQTILWLGDKLELPEGARLYSEELSGYMGTQAELLKSRLIQSRALEKVRARFPGQAPGERPFELAVKSSPKSSTLEVSATGAFPDATQFFVDAVVAEYLSFKSEERKKTSANALSSITEQISQQEQQIADRERELSAFESSNNISFLTESGLSAGSHLARLNTQLSDFRTEHRLLELLTPEQWKDIAQAPVGTSTGLSVPGEQAAQGLASSGAAQQSGYFAALQQLELLKAKRDDFAKVLRPTHSKMVKMNQEIAGLEQLLDTLKQQGEQQALAQMTNRKKSLELQIENLEAQYRTWQTNALEASRKLAQHDRMKQELERCNALYSRLLSLVQTVDITKGLEREALTQLAPASPARPTLSKYKFAAAGVLAGLVAGLGLLLVLSAAEDRFSSATELSLHLPEEVVGQVPESRLGWSGGGGRLLCPPEEQHSFTESFRNLRSHLLCMSELPAGPRVIMVTSAVPKEGKTTVTANLGATLALAGERVLIIDADVRRSSMHKIFGVQLSPGLREVLGKKITVMEAIVTTSQANLWLLPAGESEASGSELFLLGAMERMLEELRAHYDYILIDTAPVLATDDAGSLGAKTQGTFLVVRAFYTSARMIREALERLSKRKVKVLGLIYNRASQSTDYYYQYSADYYKGETVSLPGIATQSGNGNKGGTSSNQEI